MRPLRRNGGVFALRRAKARSDLSTWLANAPGSSSACCARCQLCEIELSGAAVVTKVLAGGRVRGRAAGGRSGIGGRVKRDGRRKDSPENVATLGRPAAPGATGGRGLRGAGPPLE